MKTLTRGMIVAAMFVTSVCAGVSLEGLLVFLLLLSMFVIDILLEKIEKLQKEIYNLQKLSVNEIKEMTATGEEEFWDMRLAASQSFEEYSKN